MRSFNIYGIRNGGSEQYIDTVYSMQEGMEVYRMMVSQGYYHQMVVRDALGGKQMHRDLVTGMSLMEPQPA